MLALHPKQVRLFLLTSFCVCGLALGYFTAELTGYLLQPPAEPTVQNQPAKQATEPVSGRDDKRLILAKNIFNPAARGSSAAPPAEQRPASTPVARNGNLELFGTVDGGQNPLALIRNNGKVGIYRIGDDIPGGGQLDSVERNKATIRQADGSLTLLTLVKQKLSATPAPAATAGSGIRSLGNNRWAVSRDEVEKARGNLNQLLKSARMEPNIINGQTEGFIVRMVRPKSLLARLGLRRGDTVTRVNGVELNSPEKALQIFQQLREAKRLSVDLKRSNENLTFDYEVN